MIKEKKTTKEIITRHKYCDDCGKKIKHQSMMCSVAKCNTCGKDLCENCIGEEEDTSGDYRTVYCKSCWDIGEKYRSKIEEYEKAIGDLYEEWYNKCKLK